ncbi:MAG: hypothetical protein SGJ27_06910 [Candidatus Melainabacteria bacterium]|nr:hypothetical protein [Candidatus Melainabacteria bacterium]
MKSRKLIALALALVVSAPCALANEPLQGGIEETGILPSEATKNEEIIDMPAPVLPEVPRKPLQGTIKQDALHGQADEEDPNLMGGTAVPDSDGGGGPLKGRADSAGNQQLESDDPDMDDQELQVAWDRWRNNLLYAVQTGVQEALNNPEDEMLRWDPVRKKILMKFPLGTTSWFYCKVNSNRHIVSLKIMEPSGFAGYDKAVLKAVQDLEGSSILKFPKRSRRMFVTQSAGIQTSDSGGGRRDFKFGDVERYRSGQ